MYSNLHAITCTGTPGMLVGVKIDGRVSPSGWLVGWLVPWCLKKQGFPNQPLDALDYAIETMRCSSKGVSGTT